MTKNLELCGLIYGKFPSVAAFSRTLGFSRQRMQTIVSGRTDPSIEDVVAIANGLNEPVDKIIDIFLRHKSTVVGNNQQQQRRNHEQCQRLNP